MTNKEYVMDLCRCGENDFLNYKPYENGRMVEPISVSEAVNIIERDTEELRDTGLLADDQCIEGARRIFKKHVAIFR